MLRVATDNLASLDVAQIVAQDLLREQINQCLNVCSHFFFVGGLLERTEVDIGESRLEELDVKGVTRE